MPVNNLKLAKQINKMEDCTVTTETIDGIHHTYYSRDGIVVAECRKSVDGWDGIERWYCGDKLHREDKPAVTWYENGQLIEEVWYRDGKRHREDGPAIVHYEYGQKTGDYWYRDDKRHCDDGPAIIHYKNGQKTSEFWYRDGNLYPVGRLASGIYYNIDAVEWYYARNKYVRDIDEFRDAVKGEAIHDALRPLPLPIRDAIIPHYCYQ